MEGEVVRGEINGNPPVIDLIPISTLHFWKENVQQSGTHYFVTGSVYVATLRNIIKKYNNLCIPSAINCRWTKTDDMFIARFKCSNPSCTCRAVLHINNQGQILLKFFNAGSPSASSDASNAMVVIEHIKEKKARASYVRKHERKEIQERNKNCTAQSMYIEENSKLTPEQLDFGHSCPSKRVFKEIRYEQKKNNARDPNVLNSLLKASQDKDAFIKEFTLVPSLRIITYLPSVMPLLQIARSTSLGMDGTKVDTSQSLGSTLEMYNITMENPVEKGPPIPICSAHLSVQTIEQISSFLKFFLNSLPFPFHPLHFWTDKSWAIIRSLLIAFNGHDLQDYLQVIHAILVDNAPVPKNFTIVTICSFHHHESVKRFLRSLSLSPKLKDFFFMLAVTLQSTLSWHSTIALARAMFVLCDSPSFTPEVLQAKAQINQSMKEIRFKNAQFEDITIAGEETGQEALNSAETNNSKTEKHPLASSPFRKQLLSIRQNVGEGLVSSSGDTPNPYFSPQFADYQVDHWLNFPLHLEAVYKVVHSEKAKLAAPGFRSPYYVNSTNNVSEKHNQLLKAFFGPHPLRLDEIVEKDKTYHQSLHNDFKKSGYRLPPFPQPKKKRKQSEIDKPEICKKRQTAQTDEPEGRVILAESQMQEASVDTAVKACHLMYENNSNSCAIISAINLSVNCQSANAQIFNHSQRPSTCSPFLASVFDIQLQNMLHSKTSSANYFSLKNDEVGKLKMEYLVHHAPEDRHETMHQPDRALGAIFGAHVKVATTIECSQCGNESSNLDEATWFTVPCSRDEEVNGQIMAAHASSIFEHPCSVCERNTPSLQTKKFTSVPSSFLVRIGRMPLNGKGSGQVENTPVNISPTLALDSPSGEMKFSVHGGICFSGRDNAGHYFTFTFSQDETYLIVFSMQNVEKVPIPSPRFEEICGQVVFLLYERQGQYDRNLVNRLSKHMPIFEALRHNTIEVPVSGKDGLLKNLIPASLCLNSLKIKEYSNFMQYLFAWDSFIRANSLKIHVEAHLKCSVCHTTFDGGLCIPLEALIHYSLPDFFTTIEARFRAKLKKDCSNCAQLAISISVSYLPESFAIFETVDVANRVIAALNTLRLEYVKVNCTYIRATYHLEAVYLPSEKKFCTLKNGKFTHYKGRKQVSFEGKQFFLLRLAFIEKFPTPRFSELPLPVLAHKKILPSVLSRNQTGERKVCDGLHQHVLSEQQLSTIPIPSYKLSESMISAFFIALIQKANLKSKVSFLGASHQESLVSFGTPLHPSCTNTLRAAVLLGTLRQRIPQTDVIERTDHVLLYAIDWSQATIHVYDPLGRVDETILQRIHHFAKVLSLRLEKTINFSINDLLAEKHIPALAKSSPGVRLCAMGAKLLLQQSFSTENDLRGFLLSVLLDSCSLG